jgi:hypothetical protein
MPIRTFAFAGVAAVLLAIPLPALAERGHSTDVSSQRHKVGPAGHRHIRYTSRWKLIDGRFGCGVRRLPNGNIRRCRR